MFAYYDIYGMKLVEHPIPEEARKELRLWTVHDKEGKFVETYLAPSHKIVADYWMSNIISKLTPYFDLRWKEKKEMEYLEKKYDIEYIGRQERIDTFPLYMFNDNHTKSSFAVEYLNDIPEKIKEVRDRFRM